MSGHGVFKADGLNTTANPIGSVEPGAAKVADNVVVRAKDVWEPRRGQELSSYSFTNVYDRANEVMFYNGWTLYQVGEGAIDLDTGLSLLRMGSLIPPAPGELRVKHAVARRRLYFTTSTGIQVLDDSDDRFGMGISERDILMAGIPRPFNVETKTALTDVTGENWLADNNQVAVRVCFTKRDGDGNVQLGPVSEAAVLINDSGASRSISVHMGLPSAISTMHGYRIFMTDPSGSETVHPGDECYLTYEAAISSADVTAGYVEKVVTIAESVTSDVPLYTNPNTGNGIEANKLPPPYAKDICKWGGSLWAFNIQRTQSVTISILGVDGLNDYSDPTITVNGNEYVFVVDGTTGVISGGRCAVEMAVNGSANDTGTGSGNTRLTAKALVEAINGNDSELVAYYIDRADGWPGDVLIERRELGGDAFVVEDSTSGVSAGDGPGKHFSPSIVDDGITSTPGDQPHGYAYSGVDEPESWPLTNYSTVASEGASILRGVPLKDRLYCFMDDGSIQVITGAAGQFRVDELDSTAQLIGPDTAKVANNQIWALTSQGVCTIDESGVGVVGLPIEADVRTLFGPALATTKLVSFGFGYESERSYAVALPTQAGQACAQQIFVYNYFAKTWTRWPIARSCGAVSPTAGVFTATGGSHAKDALHMGDGSTNKVRVERKTLTPDDLCDESTTVSISAASGTTLTISSATGIEVGDVVEQNSGVTRGVVTEVTDATHLEVDSEESWTAPGTLTVYKGYACEVEWQAVTMGAPGVSKNLQEYTLHFGDGSYVSASATLSTEKSAEMGDCRTMERGGWGSGEWGDSPWGDPSGPYNERVGVPLDKRDGAYFHPRFHIRQAKAPWKLLGYTLEARGVSERTKR